MRRFLRVISAFGIPDNPNNIGAAFIFLLSFFLFSMSSCRQPKQDAYLWKTMEVTASAFNSVPGQTDANPSIAAWGDTLNPGMKCIAVSRDLLSIGLHHNSKVKIEGFEGIFLVKDKMHFRWRNRIDIYMGTDVAAAREWGKKKLKIQYAVKKDSSKTELITD